MAVKFKPISILLCVCFFFTRNVLAQQYNTWYFGVGSGLNFNFNPPLPLPVNNFSAPEGCATMSDVNGNLLFYTNGNEVYNKNHHVMPNGAGLSLCTSSANAAIIVPKPGNANIYYVITSDCEESFYDEGYLYSEVNMLLNNGLGDITSQKNISLYTPSTERLTYLRHANGVDFWVITKGY